MSKNRSESRNKNNYMKKYNSIRHDLKNHLICSDLLAKQGKYNEISDHIQKFQKKLKILKKNFLFTGNDVLDAILNTKISLAGTRRDSLYGRVINCGVGSTGTVGYQCIDRKFIR